MDAIEFVSKRRRLCCLASFVLSGIASLPLFFLPSFGWFRLILVVLFFLVFYRSLLPLISRVLVIDARYSPEFKEGSYVRISRYPYDFEMDELLADRHGIYEFSFDEVGHVIDSDGVFIWVETIDGYYPTHINCLESLPYNYVKVDFHQVSNQNSAVVSE